MKHKSAVFLCSVAWCYTTTGVLKNVEEPLVNEMKCIIFHEILPFSICYIQIKNVDPALDDDQNVEVIPKPPPALNLI